jgi:formylglycine-generating enzyme required for sulfatase activity
MSGNVLEYTRDCANETYSGAPADGTVWSSGDCGMRVQRGGSWNNIPVIARAANRYWVNSWVRFNYIGFRPARMLP